MNFLKGKQKNLANSVSHTVSLSLSRPSDAEIHNVVNEAARIDAAGGVMPELCHHCIATIIQWLKTHSQTQKRMCVCVCVEGAMGVGG